MSADRYICNRVKTRWFILTIVSVKLNTATQKKLASGEPQRIDFAVFEISFKKGVAKTGISVGKDISIFFSVYDFMM